MGASGAHDVFTLEVKGAIAEDHGHMNVAPAKAGAQFRRTAVNPPPVRPAYLPLIPPFAPSVARGLSVPQRNPTVAPAPSKLKGARTLLGFLLWLLLLFLCWPIALLALLLYPLVWLVLLPFRLLGVGVEAVFELLRAIVMLPARILGNSPRR